jgi:hypothetical protein
VSVQAQGTQSASIFGPEARRLAIAGSLRLLATYFSSAETWDLSLQPAVSDLRTELDVELASAVRLRTMLALAQELVPILQSILAKPTFHYSQRSQESIGLLAGRLDVPRYVQRRSGRTAPKIYPVRVVERDHATPENVLAVAALQSISRALAAVPTQMLPLGLSPERRLLASARADLRRYARMPLTTGIASTATATLRRRPLSQQRNDVLRRINRGHLQQAAAYRQLTDWVETFLTGAGVDPDRRPWAFYDERFDPRLLEIWTLGALINCLVRRYGDPDDGQVAPLWDRDAGPIAVWTTPFGRIDLFFQRETQSVGLPGRWNLPSRDRRLRAIPDLALRLTAPGGGQTWLLLDCKLRRHAPLPAESPKADQADGGGSDGAKQALDLPIEEIYKLLGYFDHLLSGDRAFGALVYYTPGGNGSLEMTSVEPALPGGRVALIGVDPADPTSAVAAISALGDQVGALLGEPGAESLAAARQAAKGAVAEGGDATEAKAAYKQRLLVDVLRSYAQHHDDQLPAVQKLTQSWFDPGIWDDLDEDTRRMVLSAELYGSQQLAELDHSGPLLVLSAACERELNLRLFARVAAMHPAEVDDGGRHVVNTHMTLGGAIEIADRGRRLARATSNHDDAAIQRILASLDPNAARAATLTGGYLTSTSTDLARMKKVLGRLRGLNIKYRRPAAHDEVVEAQVWSDGRNTVLGRQGLLSEIVESWPTAS